MTELNVMTLNIQNSLRSSAFDARVRSIDAMVAFHNPDLIGMQELTDDMIHKLPGMSDTYAFYGKRRESIRPADERCCVLYRKTRFRFISGKTRWLSDTPEVPGSRHFGSQFPRIVTYAGAHKAGRSAAAHSERTQSRRIHDRDRRLQLQFPGRCPAETDR